MKAEREALDEKIMLLGQFQDQLPTIEMQFKIKQREEERGILDRKIKDTKIEKDDNPKTRAVAISELFEQMQGLKDEKLRQCRERYWLR